jgi:hypothetical protein
VDGEGPGVSWAGGNSFPGQVVMTQITNDSDNLESMVDGHKSTVVTTVQLALFQIVVVGLYCLPLVLPEFRVCALSVVPVS